MNTKKLIYAIPLLLAGLAFSFQAPGGTVDVSTTVTATAGTLVCVGTPTVATSVSTMRIKCSDGDAVLHEAAYTVSAPGSTTYSISRGGNMITWLLTKGNPTPDRWEVAANGVAKSGSF